MVFYIFFLVMRIPAVQNIRLIHGRRRGWLGWENPFHHSGGDTDGDAVFRNVAADNSTCTNRTAIPDCRARQNHSSGTDPAGAADGNGTGIHNALQTLCHIRGMVDRDNVDLRPNSHIVTNGYKPTVVNDETGDRQKCQAAIHLGGAGGSRLPCIGVEVMPDGSIATVQDGEGYFDPRIFLHISQQGLENLHPCPENNIVSPVDANL